MSQASRVIPGQALFITRRTERRTFLLRPDAALNQLVLYLVAFFAQKFSMCVSALVVLSDHYHMVVTDPLGWRPEFVRELHRVLALCVKVLRKWDGVVWEPDKQSTVELLTPQAVVQQMVYTWLNAVRAGLVKDARQWPGVTTGLESLDGPSLVIQRPEHSWLNPASGTWPEQVELKLQMPPMLAELGMAKARRMLKAELERQLAEAEAQRRERGWKVLGAKRCRKVSPQARATSWEPVRSRTPVLAVGRGLKELRRAAIAELQQFRAEYREALERWRQGKRRVLFPYGTWAMVKLHGARVRAPAPSS
jgi:hypothetical protein